MRVRLRVVGGTPGAHRATQIRGLTDRQVHNGTPPMRRVRRRVGGTFEGRLLADRDSTVTALQPARCDREATPIHHACCALTQASELAHHVVPGDWAHSGLLLGDWIWASSCLVEAPVATAGGRDVPGFRHAEGTQSAVFDAGGDTGARRADPRRP